MMGGWEVGGIHPTRTIFVPNIPTTLPAQQWEGERTPTVSVGRNIKAFSLASLLESGQSLSSGLFPGVRGGGADPESR